jgi:hypothetical protein
MMFPDTTDDKQCAALRHAAERARRLANPQLEYGQAMWKPMPPMRAGFDAGNPQQLSRYESGSEEHPIVSH